MVYKHFDNSDRLLNRDNYKKAQEAVKLFENIKLNISSLDKIEKEILYCLNTSYSTLYDHPLFTKLMSPHIPKKTKEKIVEIIEEEFKTGIINKTEIKNLSDEIEYNEEEEFLKKEEEIINSFKQIENDSFFKNSRKISLEELKKDGFDFLSNSVYKSDESLMKFFVKHRSIKIMTKLLKEETDFSLEDFLNDEEVLKEIRDKVSFYCDELETIIIPKDFISRKQLDLMQKFLAVSMIEEKRFCNFSEPGEGKSLAAIFTSVYFDCKNTLIIAKNGTEFQWKQEIEESVKDAEIIIYDKQEQIKLSESQKSFLIVPYSKLQIIDYGSYFLKNVLKDNKMDFIVLDEVHFLKRNTTKEETNRRYFVKKIMDLSDNPNLYVLGMTATPIINGFRETWTILELITGKLLQYKHPKRNSRSQALSLYVDLINYGIRFNTLNINFECKEEIEKINALPYIDVMLGTKELSPLQREKVIANIKLKEKGHLIKPGTIIYTEYMGEGFIDIIKNFLKSIGATFAEYTGEENTLEQFKNGNKDVLIASSPILFGIDGLQYIEDVQIFVLTMPWTYAAFKQLKGRLIRKGTTGDTRIIIPLLTFFKEDTGEEKDLNTLEVRFDAVNGKRILFYAGLEAKFEEEIISEEKLTQKAFQNLESLLSRIKSEGFIEEVKKKKLEDAEVVQELSEPEKEDVEVEKILALIKEDDEIINVFKKEQKDLPDEAENKEEAFELMCNQFSQKTSRELYDLFMLHRDLYNNYCNLFEKKSLQWKHKPEEYILDYIKNNPNTSIVNFGARKNEILLEAKEKKLANRFFAFDYVPLDNSVVMTNLGNLNGYIDNYFADTVFSVIPIITSDYLACLRQIKKLMRPFNTSKFIFIDLKSNWEDKEKLEGFKQDLRFVGFENITIEDYYDFKVIIASFSHVSDTYAF